MAKPRIRGMKMRHKIGNTLIGIGVFLILIATSLYLFNIFHEYEAGKNVKKYLPELKKQIESNNTQCSGNDNSSDGSETVLIDGMRFLGILSVPSKELELPILADYSYDMLDTAPCRYSGSYDTNDMVIGGHNYSRHFSKLRSIKQGAEINFTSNDGTVYKYRVLRVEILEPTQIYNLINKMETNDWDLTLFTCTMSGETRCVIRCERQSD